jgi:hypothetical protein
VFPLQVFHELLEQDRCFASAVDSYVFDGFIIIILSPQVE